MADKQRRSAASKKAWRSRKRRQGAQTHVLAVAKPVTRADRIRALLDAGKNCQETAALEGCSDAYVRVVRVRARQPYEQSANWAWRVRHRDRDLKNRRMHKRAWRARKRETQANG